MLSARTVFVEVGSSRISGTGPIGGTVAVTVKTNGAVRGTLKRAVRMAPTDRAGTFSGTLRKNGAAVKVKAGDRVTVQGPAASVTVPVRSLEVLPALNGRRPSARPQRVPVLGERRPDGEWQRR